MLCVFYVRIVRVAKTLKRKSFIFVANSVLFEFMCRVYICIRHCISVLAFARYAQINVQSRSRMHYFCVSLSPLQYDSRLARRTTEKQPRAQTLRRARATSFFQPGALLRQSIYGARQHVQRGRICERLLFAIPCIFRL